MALVKSRKHRRGKRRDYEKRAKEKMQENVAVIRDRGTIEKRNR